MKLSPKVSIKLEPTHDSALPGGVHTASVSSKICACHNSLLIDLLSGSGNVRAQHRVCCRAAITLELEALQLTQQIPCIRHIL
jgi:hypothetical protein